MSHSSKFLADQAHAAILSDHLDRRDPSRIERRAAAHERRQAKIAEANARRDEAMATPLSPAMHRTMIVLAVLSALTVIGLPITALIAYMLHAKAKAYTARADAQRAAAAAEADRYLTAEDRDWMRRNSGQV